MIKKVKISDLKKGPIQHPVLPDGFVERVKAFKETLDEVNGTSIQATLDDFKRDRNPESELIVWEHIASTYKLFLSHNPTDDLAIKKEIFSVLLGASMGMQEWSNIKHLTQDQINHLVLNYKGL